jgi:hypothetical protein
LSKELVKLIDGELCISSAAMYEVFHLSQWDLGKWASMGCPKVRAGWWPLGRVIEWRGLSSARNADNGQETTEAMRKRYEAEYKRLQAESLELKNAIAKGEYLPRDEIVADLSRYFSQLKRSLMGLSRKLAMETGSFVDATTARRIETELTELITDALEQMSIGDVYTAPKTKIK